MLRFTDHPSSTSECDGPATWLPAGALTGKRVLILVENLPLPFDRRVWQEAKCLTNAGAVVSIICPTGKGYEAEYEEVDGVHIYRHPLPLEARGALGFLVEYSAALFHETRLAWKIFFRHGIDVVQACNPPDLLFLVALQFKLLGRRFIFDHHDISPELYEAKFGKRGVFWRLLCIFEWLTFKCADVVISTNESYREIALKRGGKKPKDVFVVRSGPDLSKLKPPVQDETLKEGKAHLVGYVGVMGEQEGLDLLLQSIRHLVFVLGRRDTLFILVGSGPELPALQQLAQELGISEFVRFPGRVSDDRLFKVLATSEVCVNPDRVNVMNDKSTMNKILEYMAFSKPIVQFDVTEGRYSAQDASLYAQPNDPADFAGKMNELLSSPVMRQQMGRLGRQRLEADLSWDIQKPRLLGAYHAAFYR